MKHISKLTIIKLASILILLAVVITCTILVYQYDKGALPLDAAIRDFAYQIRGEKGGVIYWITRVVTELGYYPGVAIVLISVGIYTKFDERFFLVAFAVLTMHLSNSEFKHIVLRPRPLEEFRWQVETSTSFPSGHSATAGVLYTSALMVVLHSNLGSKIKTAAKIVLPLTILVVMTTRVILGVHYFSDVLAGAAFGSTIAIAYSLLMDPAHKLYGLIVEKIKQLIKKEKTQD